MRQAEHDRHGLRLRALIAVLWRAGLRISEALALNTAKGEAQDAREVCERPSKLSHGRCTPPG